jgi:hypothetical protein
MPAVKGAIVIGKFEDPSVNPLSGVAVEMPALDLVAHWRRCGMSADFLAGYMAYDYANRPVATNVLSTVINEILENAAKFSADKRCQVRVAVTQHGDSVCVEASNTTSPDRAESFRKCLEEVLSVDAEELFRRHLESASSAPPGAPGVGLVVLRKDYEAELGVRITPRADGLFEVTVQVRLSAEEVDQ